MISAVLNLPLTVLYGMCALVTYTRPRSHRVRIAGIALVCIAVSLLVRVYAVDFYTNSTAIEAPLAFALLSIFALGALRLPSHEALHVSVWALILASFLFECTDSVTLPLSEPVHTTSVCAAAALAWIVPLSGRICMTRADVTAGKLGFALSVGALYLLASNYQFIFFLLGSRAHSVMIPVFRISIAALSLLVLYLRYDIEQRDRARMELELMQQLWKEKQHQYEISKETIDIINRKSHDLKYQLAAFRTMERSEKIDHKIREVEDSIQLYDASISTGNSVLDVVLTEKALYCESQKITMTCMAHAQALSFLDPVDLYTLFGNALDNAIESVRQNDDPDLRLIHVSVTSEKGCALIRVRNSFTGSRDAIHTVEGLPPTTKSSEPGYHGFGLSSIRYTAEKYSGTMSIHTDETSFTLRILIPLPL